MSLVFPPCMCFRLLPINLKDFLGVKTTANRKQKHFFSDQQSTLPMLRKVPRVFRAFRWKFVSGMRRLSVICCSLSLAGKVERGVAKFELPRTVSRFTYLYDSSVLFVAVQ